MKQVSLKTLLDSGVLFEINRQLLHPLGYSLSYRPSMNSEETESLILQRTDDAEGVLYDEKNFMDGAAKFAHFMKTMGEDLIRRRVTKIGFIRQTRSDQ
jgi:hypothetical protein